MSERIKTESTAEKKEGAEFLPYFPTDLERAKSGIEKFNEVFERSSVLKEISVKDKFFKLKTLCCVTGLMPKTGYFWGSGFRELNTDEKRAELKRIYEEKFGLKTLHWQRFDESEKWDHSVFNPTSVEKAIRNCPIPDLFPEEAKKNPIEWVLNNPLEWADCEDPKLKARFGVLSGYPPHGSSVYYEYKKAQSFIDEAWTERERKAYYKYANSPRETREFPKNLEDRLNEAINTKKISERQAQLLKDWFSHRGALEFFGDGFFDEDEKYFDNIRIILEKLGIKDNK